MRFRPAIQALRLIAGVVFAVCSSLSVQAQYVDEDTDVEDWQLYDEAETDTVPKPSHKEWRNTAYMRYSPALYMLPERPHRLRANEVAIGWAKNIQVADSIPLFVEAGAEMKYSYSPSDTDRGNAKYNLLTFLIPVNVAYKFYLSHTRNIALIPAAGVHFSAIALGKEKVDGNSINLFDKDKDNHTGTSWDRCHLGWQVSMRMQIERFLLSVSYGRDFPNKSSQPEIRECGVTLGLQF